MPERRPLRPAIFLDRDGTVAEEVGYLNHPSRFRMFPFVAGAIQRLKENGYAVVIVTNQSGVGRGYFPESVVQEVNQLMARQLSAEGASIDGVYYCPHTSAENCNCRKPKTGMLERAAREHALDLRRSFVVGDRYGDIELAHNAQTRGILVRTGYGEGEFAWHAAKWPVQPDFVAQNLADAAEWIVRQPR
ncbi:MAG TPA: HAD family hydrolase [Candidatus Angelobacter sp.]|nr:HAD family hydrolase [Candidatus Angelobacter sp.]